MIRGDDRVSVGIARLEVVVPGARSLKDRRQVLVSIRDRILHRFAVSFHEVGTGDDAQRQTVVITTAGNDAKLIRSVLDQCIGVLRDHPVAQLGQVDVDVFRWHPSEQSWASRMMAELGGAAEDRDE
ncbi:MAG: DUF503 domain-containing protein [Myxococcota bacterium]